MTTHLASLPFALLACVAAPETDSGADTAAETGSDAQPYNLDPAADAPATLDIAEIESAITEALRIGPIRNGGPVFPAYFEVMGLQTAECPAPTLLGTDEYWYADCTTDGGTAYKGHDHYRHVTDTFDGIDSIYTGDYVYGVSTIQDAEGHLFENGGTASHFLVERNDGSSIAWSSAVQGVFSYDGPAAGDSWLTTPLGADLAPDLSMIGYYYPANDGRAFTITGGLSGISEHVSTVAFTNVSLFDEKAGGACPIEPGGVVSVLDDQGAWYDIVLDGEPSLGAGVDASLCDGCGTAWSRGVAVGQVCVDYTVLTAWGASPW